MKILLTLLTQIAVWSVIGGLMAGAVWFGVYMVKGLIDAIN